MTDSLADLLKRQRESTQQPAGTPVADKAAEPEPQPRKHGFADIVAQATKLEPSTTPEAPDDAEEMARVAKEQAAKAATAAAVVAGKAARQAAEKTTATVSKLKRRWQTYRAEAEAKRKVLQATTPADRQHRPTLIVDGRPYQVATPKDHRNLRNGLILLGGLVVIAGLVWGGVEMWHPLHATTHPVVVAKQQAKIKGTLGKTAPTVITRPKVAVFVPKSSAPAVTAPPPPHPASAVVPKPKVATPAPQRQHASVARHNQGVLLSPQHAPAVPIEHQQEPRRHVIGHHISTARRHIDAQAKQNIQALRNFFKQVNQPSNSGGQP